MSANAFFLLIACGKGAVGSTGRACCPTAHSHARGLILSASDGIWNMLSSTYSHTSHWVRFRFSGCLSLVVAHVRPTHLSPIRFLRTSLMPSQPGSASASPLGSTSTAVCCASSTSNSSPLDIGRGSFCAACSYHGSSRRLAPATGRARLTLPESANFCSCA